VRYNGQLYRLALQQNRSLGLIDKMPLEDAMMAVASLIERLRSRAQHQLRTGRGREEAALVYVERRLTSADDAVMLSHAIVTDQLDGSASELDRLLAEAYQDMKNAGDAVRGL
jgi:galactokinase